VVIAQAMIEEVSLPFDFLMYGQEVFPVRYSSLHACVLRKSNNGVEMIRHEKHESTMPRELLVIVRRRSKDGIAGIGAAELIETTSFAVDCDLE
jgi:hypothetical protein